MEETGHGSYEPGAVPFINPVLEEFRCRWRAVLLSWNGFQNAGGPHVSLVPLRAKLSRMNATNSVDFERFTLVGFLVVVR